MSDWFPTLFLIAVMIFGFSASVFAVAVYRMILMRLDENRIREHRLKLRPGPWGMVLGKDVSKK
jgi:hypothetical protein